MKKSYKLCVAFFAVIAMSSYLAYIDADIYSSVSDYLDMHINNPQQYLYIISLYAILVLWAIFVPYLEPCFYLRFSNIVEQINKRNVIYSLIFGISTFFIYLITALAFGYCFECNMGFLMMIIKLIMYYFMCFELSTSIYFLFKKPILSLISLFVINLAAISIYYAIEFYIFANRISEDYYHQAFNIYIISLAVACLAFNEFYIKRKELI